MHEYNRRQFLVSEGQGILGGNELISGHMLTLLCMS